ncbi:inorganic phosphate transporter [Nemorincola caseinilytica]|uniref:Phosphate transporter n=1 Tax=Nemorincola caseinilytica TaxID=2054315 RepID=A0ABP8N5B6_9BACT
MSVLLIVIIVLALLFDYINGFHDAANSIATVVSTKVLTPLQAVLWAALFNFVAFFIFKDHGVAKTVAKTVHDGYITLPVIFSGLVAAIAWNLFTWWFGIPSSSSHTLIGGFAGAAIANGGFAAINSEPVIKTVSFIVLAPLIGMIMAFIISLWFIYSFRKGWRPKVVSLIIMVTVSLLVFHYIETDPSKLKNYHESYIANVLLESKNLKWLLLGVIMVAMCVFTMVLGSLNTASATQFLKRFQLVSSAIFSVGHGGNDAQKVMGIITAALYCGGEIAKDQMPTWVPLACYTAIAVGTMSGGWKIIKTMGTRITKVTPFEGVAAETAGAITLFLTENLKIPVSTTHTITGSIIGVGATKRVSAVRWGVTINLLWAWILTIPVSAMLAAGCYAIVRLFV